MASTEPLPLEDTFRLREYLAVLWVRKWSILALALVGFLGAYYFTQSQTREYTSTVTVIATEPLGAIDQQNNPDMSVERSLVTSETVSACASKIVENAFATQADADLDALCAPDALANVSIQPWLKPGLVVVVPPDSTVLQIKKTDQFPLRARDTAQAFALAYTHYRTANAFAELTARRAPLLERIKQLSTAVTNVNKQINTELAQTLPNLPRLTGLYQHRGSLEGDRSDINQQLLELSAAKVNQPQIVDSASLPKQPSSPNELLNLLVGVFVGLALGLATAFLRAHLDDRVRSRADLEEVTGIPVLAVILKEPGLGLRKASLVTRDSPRSPAAEGYRRLRASVLLASAQRGVKTLMVVGPESSESKTAANLALALAYINKRVVLVSADLRRPQIHQFFTLDNATGLSTVLAGDAELWGEIKDPLEKNLRVLSSGPPVSRPGELVQSDEMRDVLFQLREVADFVIVDTAPVMAAADAATLSPAVDGILLVARCGTTKRASFGQAHEHLQQLGAPLLGAVLTNFDASKAQAHLVAGVRYQYRYPRASYALPYEVSGNGGPPSTGQADLPAPTQGATAGRPPIRRGL